MTEVLILQQLMTLAAMQEVAAERVAASRSSAISTVL